LKALVALLVVDILDSQLSQQLTLAQFLPQGFIFRWDQLNLVLGVTLFAFALIACIIHIYPLLRAAVLTYLGMATLQLLANIVGLVLLLSAFKGGVGAFELLWNAIAVWVINVVVFSVWYWQIDSGGPHRRTAVEERQRPDFFFPQRTGNIHGWMSWNPDFIDYLFLSFTTSTTFGPADTFPLSHRAKSLMMIQVGVSLTVLTVLAARAVSIIS
jgi:hypothetical protein